MTGTEEKVGYYAGIMVCNSAMFCRSHSYVNCVGICASSRYAVHRHVLESSLRPFWQKANTFTWYPSSISFDAFLWSCLCLLGPCCEVGAFTMFYFVFSILLIHSLLSRCIFPMFNSNAGQFSIISKSGKLRFDHVAPMNLSQPFDDLTTARSHM